MCWLQQISIVFIFIFILNLNFKSKQAVYVLSRECTWKNGHNISDLFLSKKLCALEKNPNDQVLIFDSVFV